MTRLVVPLTLRQRAIIQGVIQANGHVTYDELAQSTRLSVRVIRYNMRSVRLWFASHDVPLTTRAGYGIEIDASRATRRQLLLALARSMDQDVVLAGAQRRRAFLFQMLCSDTPASFQNLAIQAGSSRSTLIHDVGKMQDWLARFNIQIVRRPKVGIHLSGEEHMRRFALALVLREELGEERWRSLASADAGLFTQDRSLPAYIRAYLEQLNLAFAAQMLTKIEHNLGRRPTTQSQAGIVTYLAIMIHALRAGKIIPPISSQGLLSTVEHKVALILVKDLSRLLGIDIPQSEPVLFAAYLLGSEWENAELNPVDGPAAGREPDPEAMACSREIVSRCASQLHPLLQIDQELVMGLAQHLERAMHRLRHGIPVKNALLETVRTRYAEVHRSAAHSVAPLEARLGARFSQDELGFVTMYLAAALERIGTNRRFVRPVLLVAEGDKAKTTLLRSRLEYEFPTLEVVGVCEPAAALEPDIPRAELIVALVPYEHPRLPTLHIGPFLTGEEIKAIRSWLAAKESEERRAALSQPAKLGIVELLEPSSIVFQTGTMDWRRSVVLAAEPLIHAAKITPSYVKAMIQILDEFGPYMILAPGVILLHAKPSDGVNSLCFSLLVHRDGINFGSPLGKVHVLFVLGAVDNQSHLTALFQLSNLLQTAGFVQKLRQAENPADALRTIWSYIAAADSPSMARVPAERQPAR